MPPSAVETVTAPAAAEITLITTLTKGDYKVLGHSKLDKEAEEERRGLRPRRYARESHAPASLSKGLTIKQYPHYLPTWNPEQKYAPLEPFEHVEHGKDADPSYPDLLPAGVQAVDLTPSIGTEVRGIQLSALSPAGKDQLARYVAERKVVAFRDQDFKDLPIQDALDYGGYFGRHHIHPTSGSPEGYPEIHLVHRGAGDNRIDEFFKSRVSSVAWHSDVSYEQQPPGTTFLYIFDKPETGGDTLFANAVEAYNRLSPLFQERLHGLKATHSGIEQANASTSRGGIKRREPVVTEHPIVRTHPVTGERESMSTRNVSLNPFSPHHSARWALFLTFLSHPGHCRVEEGGVRRDPQVPV